MKQSSLINIPHAKVQTDESFHNFGALKFDARRSWTT